MKTILTFTDQHGKKGHRGSKVVDWMFTISPGNPDEIAAKIAANTKEVEDIWRQGAGGTKIKLKGERGGSPSKSYIIVE